MAETLTVVDGIKLEYEGLFDPKELYTVIDELFKQHSFDKHEFRNAELTHKEGKDLVMDLRPYKRLSDYLKTEIKIEIMATNLKHVEIKKKGLKKKMYKGHIDITFTAFIITDYEHAWETRPIYYLIRMLIDKFIYKGYTEQVKNEIITLTNECYDEVRSYLNMNRYIAEPITGDKGIDHMHM
ncbi:hypothetical protein HQ533_05485 [Candidatus Woesearchaeota archaeon]|nr:hypothetical protein [Candidatus Woesearchaeota archaeon]